MVTCEMVLFKSVTKKPEKLLDCDGTCNLPDGEYCTAFCWEGVV